jgi:catechol 2,3-dioxygenase-like lactoylglutathione lyase family enzyme
MDVRRMESMTLTVHAIAHVTIEVSDLQRALAFYAGLIGGQPSKVAAWPGKDETALRFPSGQFLVLKSSADPRTLPDSAVHQAYRAAPAAIDRILQSLGGDAGGVHRYYEDRPAERADNCYFADPEGNRIQLIADAACSAPGIAAIDHAIVLASDMEWIEEFYCDQLGLVVEHRVGWNTADYIRARAWGEGKEDMAPGTRRWDERYRDIPGAKPGQGRRLARPNMQIFLQTGESILGIYLSPVHVQESPPRLALGTPRIGFWTDRATLERAVAVLGKTRATVAGPVHHVSGSPVAASLYFRDPCGNFIELCVRETT